MKIEVLNPEQYSELAGIEEGFIPPWDNGVVFVARDDAGKIIGRSMILFVPHIEGTWVHPDHRGSTIAYRLIRAVGKSLAKSGAGMMLAYSQDVKVDDYLKRIGFELLPIKVFRKAVK